MAEQAYTQPIPRSVLHIGVVVHDIDQAINHYSTVLGLGPFRTTEANLPRGTLHGKPASFNMKAAFASLGSVQFELIEVPEGDSIYREFVESHGEGLHHLCIEVADLDAEVTRLHGHGIEVLQGAEVSDELKFAYVDTGKVGGVIFELAQRPAV